ncbi:MAG: Bifunctional polymyxin resistance protein ArnA [Legionellaceae bacterium]
MSLNILILGINGFIGSHLADQILANTDWNIVGMDLTNTNLIQHSQNERMYFKEGDITKESTWIEEYIQKSDIILPLVAVATPATYVQNPIRVFELDFEANLPIIRWCVKYKKRVIFPSTSEVYGMCPDETFDEENSQLVLGPIHKERWIYSCAKQMMDRVIYAYGAHQGLHYTLFRPFNWIGPRQDNIFATKAGSSRVLTQFISNVIHGQDIQLVEGGLQKRCFTYIDDGINALIKIIANENQQADNRIFNIGNPYNNYSIQELAEKVVAAIKKYPAYTELAEKTRIITTEAKQYYGNGYQDVNSRVPAIKNAKTYLNWEPKITLDDAIIKTLDFYFNKR